MRKFKKIVAILLVVAALIAACAVMAACDKESTPATFAKAGESSDGYATIYVPDDRDVKIMVLSDPQVDVYEKYKVVGSPGNDKTYAFVEDFVKTTKPDFVIINGDLVMNDLFLKSSTPYFDKYAEIFERLNTPWTFTFGNHDCDAQWTSPKAEVDSKTGQCSKEKLIAYMSQKYPHCLINTDEKCLDGDGNHFVNVRKRSGELVYTLCLFDCTFDKDKNYNYTPTANQVNWYRDTVNAISDTELGKDRGENVVKSMIFNHVGIPEFKEAWQKAWNNGNPTSDYFYGHYFEGNYSSKYGDMPENERIFPVVKELASTTAIFMCHHHDNDFSVNYEGVRLTFGQHSGYSHNYRTTHKTHGNLSNDYDKWSDVSFERIDDYGDQRGGTLVEISGNGEFSITPTYAKEVLANYKTDYYIDYDEVAASLEANEKFENGKGKIKRGENRLWKFD